MKHPGPVYQALGKQHFDQVIALGNSVHGDNYLDPKQMADLYQCSFSNGINASWVAIDGNELVGFRLTISADNWQPDNWCSPSMWQVPADKVCYFKCNTVHPEYQGLGIGSRLLSLSVE